MENFTKEESRKYMFKKHLRNHAFEYILDIIGPVLLTLILLHLCKAENYFYGILVACIYALTKTAYNIYHYKKEYIDVDIKEEENEKQKDN